MAVTLSNSSFTFYTQNDIKVFQSTEHSNFSLNAAFGDYETTILGPSLKTIQVYVSKIRHN